MNGGVVGGISARAGKVGPERPETKPTFVALRTGRAFHSSGWGCRPRPLDHSPKMFEFPCAVTGEAQRDALLPLLQLRAPLASSPQGSHLTTSVFWI